MNAKAVLVPIVPAIDLARILYATDFSAASLTALPLVSTVARQYKSDVFLANIWSPVPYTLVTPENASTLDQTQEEEARAQAREVLNSPELSGLNATVILEPGSPVVELKRIVRQQKIDLVIVGTHGRTGFKHLLMGSVTEELLRSLPCPVLTVGPNVTKQSMESAAIKQILFPTDLSEESRTVFPYVASLASQYRALLTVLHVLPVELVRNPDANTLAEPLRLEMQKTFYPLIDPRSPAEFVIDCGDPVERILAHAESGKAGLIGLGVRRAGDIIAHFRNTVTYRVLLGAHCPVLTARAQD